MRGGLVHAYRAVVGRYAGAALAAWLGCQALHNKSVGSDRLAGASHGPQRRTGPGCASEGAGLKELAPGLAIIQATTQAHANRIVRATGTRFVARSARSSFLLICLADMEGPLAAVPAGSAAAARIAFWQCGAVGGRKVAAASRRGLAMARQDGMAAPDAPAHRARGCRRPASPKRDTGYGLLARTWRPVTRRRSRRRPGCLAFSATRGRL